MTKRDERFTFVVNGEERQLIARLAQRLQRSQSDAVRVAVRNAAAQFAGEERQAPAAAGEVNHAQ